MLAGPRPSAYGLAPCWASPWGQQHRPCSSLWVSGTDCFPSVSSDFPRKSELTMCEGGWRTPQKSVRAEGVGVSHAALRSSSGKHWEKALLRKSVVSDRLQRLLQPKLLK